MRDFPDYYMTLFNGVSAALYELENQNYGNAEEILEKALEEAEKQYPEEK